MATPQVQLNTANLAPIPPSSSSSDDGSSTSKGDSLLGYAEEPPTPATSHLSPIVEGFAELKVSNSANTTTTTTTAYSPSTHTDTTPPILHADADPSLSAHEHDTFKSKYAAPPPVKNPYKPSEALDDIHGVSYALELFLASKMFESEDYCHKSDEKKERLYFATGYGLIQCVKGLMSYEDDDLLAGIAHTKQGNLIASQHRKKAGLLSLGGLLGGGGVNWIKSMTPVERHAELVYAESLFEKALLGIVYSGDWLAFIKEALNMRTTIGIYRQLGQYIEAVDAEYASTHSSPNSSPSSSSSKIEDPSIDADFRSGVYLGVGMCNIILSLMPGKLMTLVELFGYHGDRKMGLEYLMKAGGWSAQQKEPSVSIEQEGVRRSICDMSLLIFHLVLSSFTFDGVDIGVAQNVLEWNLKRYPSGVFFLFGAGRLGLCRSQPKRAIHYYTKAMETQSQYRNLHHISYWEIAIANLALWDLHASLKCWKELEAEATWSKAIYSYGMAVCILEIGDEKQKSEAAKLMARVPDLRQKIAGKSIPLEKFVARKARKFRSQNNRLALPALEIAYLFMGIAHAPREVIISKMLPEVDALLAKLDRYASKPKEYEKGLGYWDDLCLAKFLKGVCLRYVAYPDPDAELDPNEVVSIPKEEAAKGAEEAFRAVFEHGPKIELDHHLVYHAHYELGRLLACQGDEAGARNEFELVLSSKHLEVNATGKKGKYSMENALHMRTHAANDALHQKRL